MVSLHKVSSRYCPDVLWLLSVMTYLHLLCQDAAESMRICVGGSTG